MSPGPALPSAPDHALLHPLADVHHSGGGQPVDIQVHSLRCSQCLPGAGSKGVWKLNGACCTPCSRLLQHLAPPGGMLPFISPASVTPTKKKGGTRSPDSATPHEGRALLWEGGVARSLAAGARLGSSPTGGERSRTCGATSALLGGHCL